MRRIREWSWLTLVGVGIVGWSALTMRPLVAQEPAARATRLWSVVVSVEQYPAPIPARPGLIADGRKLARWVVETAGWGNDSVLELNDNGDPRPGPPQARAIPLRPTRENLNWATEDWLGARVKPGDVVLLSFAGRGAVTPGGEVLLPIDANPKDLKAAGWSPDRAIERLLREYKCAAVLCWIDAPMNDAPNSAAGEALVNRLARWPGASIWLSTSDRKNADGRGSAFSSALRAALGETPRSLLATLAAMDNGDLHKGASFRQRGGFPGELNLYKSRLQSPRSQRADLLVQKGHAGAITAMALRADGRTLATASEDSTIRLWRVNERERALSRVMPEFLNGVTSLAFSGDGRYLAGGDGMGSVLVWDLESKAQRPIAPNGPKPHVDRVENLIFLPDENAEPTGRRFVSLGQNGRCEVWDLDGTALRHGPNPLLATGGLRIAAATASGGPAAFAVVSQDGRLRAFDRAAKPIGDPWNVIGGRPTALHMSDDGRRLAVGTDLGRVFAVNLATRETVVSPEPTIFQRIKALRFGPDSRLAVASDAGLFLAEWDDPAKAKRVSGFEGPAASVEFAASGEWLGACSDVGTLTLFSLSDGEEPKRVSLKGAEGESSLACLRFGTASGVPLLVAGENDGGVRRWDLRNLKEYPRIAPHRGKVSRIGATDDGRYLFQITDDGAAQVWDLQQGREVRTLPGLYTAGAFLSYGRLVLARHPDDGGGLAVIDRATGREAGKLFRLPEGQIGEYGMVRVSHDGQRVAASSASGREEVVHLWDRPDAPARIIAGHTRPLTAIDFSPDGRFLLTASEDGGVKVWALDVADGHEKPAAEFRDPRIEVMTAARFSPAGPGRIAAVGLTGSDDSLAVYWEWKPGALGGEVKPVTLGRLASRAQAITFLANGRYIAAAGRDRKMRVWEVAEGKAPNELRIVVDPDRSTSESAYHHSESINDLLAWPRPEGPTLVSASADTTIRFWLIETDNNVASLLGTLTSAPDDAAPLSSAKTDGKPGARKVGAVVTEAPWVAFTPSGVYDGSQDGDGLVSFVRADEVSPLSQYSARLFQPLLTDQLRKGVRPSSKPYTAPPPLLIEASEEIDPSRVDARLTVSLGDSTLKPDNLRLYQNDVPIRAGGGFEPTGQPGEYRVDVRLARGDNKIYAMAERPGDIDARSSDITLYHSGPENPGRMHVVALGVSRYQRNALQYPDQDAKEIADYLQRHGVGASKLQGQTILLTDDKVSEKSVQTAFESLRKSVRGHPEDTVVVFLAGHTDILTDSRGENRFALLLPEFPFPENAPAQAVVRGAGVATGSKAPPAGSYLAYSTIYRNLTRMDALQRLVIVDACQAESVKDDPGVRVVEQLQSMERESRQTRVAYFLASRRGEAALEATELRHGLLTYVLLRGMGASGLSPAPNDLAAFRDYPNADRDGDGRITTRELRGYVDLTLPPLTSRFEGAIRAGTQGNLLPRPNTTAPPAALAPRTQAAGASFPLVELPRTETAARAGAGGN